MATGQRRTVDVGRGLFVVRYVAAEDRDDPPIVRVAIEAGFEPHVRLVLHPDHEEPALFEPGSCLVVEAMTPAKLGIEVEPRQSNGSVAATVNIEPLTQGSAPVAKPARRKVAARAPGAFQVLGHIAGIGDTYVKANEWLAGPTAPSRIEGIAVEWPDKPDGVDVGYSVKTGQPMDISGRVMGLGAFAGTRGRAMALTGLMMQLSGANAADYQFAVEALFLGSPVMRMSGQRIVLSGPTGREPLVGLKVAIVAAGQEQSGPRAEREVEASQPSPAARSSGRVRVFRSRPKSG